jgi:hypothetical protein
MSEEVKTGLISISIKYHIFSGDMICDKECPFLKWGIGFSECRLFGSLRKDRSLDIRHLNCIDLEVKKLDTNI